MTQVQVDQALLQKLGGLVAPVELRDANGQVVGHCLPEPDYQRMLYASFKLELSDEEIAPVGRNLGAARFKRFGGSSASNEVDGDL